VLATPDRDVTVRFSWGTGAMSRLDGKLAIIVGEALGIGMLTVRRLAVEAVCGWTGGGRR
jgi:hypothetical protein